jgi:hypothetical protein
VSRVATDVDEAVVGLIVAHGAPSIQVLVLQVLDDALSFIDVDDPTQPNQQFLFVLVHDYLFVFF